MDLLHITNMERFSSFKPKNFQYLSPNKFKGPYDSKRLFYVRISEAVESKLHRPGSMPGFNPETKIFRINKNEVLALKKVKKKKGDERSARKLYQMLDQFVLEQVIPMIEKHGAVFIKDSIGGGGERQIRLSQKMGKIVMETTDEAIALEFRRMQLYHRMVSELRANFENKKFKALQARYNNLYTDIFDKPLNERLNIWRNEKGKAIALNRNDFIKADSYYRDPLLKILTQQFLIGTGASALLCQAEIPHLKTGGLHGKPVEYRMFFIRQPNGAYSLKGSYAKVGKQKIASNIGLGGTIQPAEETLLNGLQKSNIGNNEQDRKRMAE